MSNADDVPLMHTRQQRPPARRSPTPQEIARSAVAVDRAAPVEVHGYDDERGRAVWGAPHSDSSGHRRALRGALATGSDAFVNTELDYLGALAGPSARLSDPSKVNAALALIQATGPYSEVEAALGAQLAAAHSLTMKFMVRAANSEYDPRSAALCAQTALRFGRLAGEMALLLSRLRGPCEGEVRLLELSERGNSVGMNAIKGIG